MEDEIALALKRVPACLFIVDTKREEIAVREANRLKIPIVAICDTNVDPDLVAYPIPGNDDAIRSIRLITSLVAESIIAGRRRFAVAQAAPEAAADGNGAPVGEEAGSAEPAASA